MPAPQLWGQQLEAPQSVELEPRELPAEGFSYPQHAAHAAAALVAQVHAHHHSLPLGPVHNQGPCLVDGLRLVHMAVAAVPESLCNHSQPHPAVVGGRRPLQLVQDIDVQHQQPRQLLACHETVDRHQPDTDSALAAAVSCLQTALPELLGHTDMAHPRADLQERGYQHPRGVAHPVAVSAALLGACCDGCCCLEPAEAVVEQRLAAKAAALQPQRMQLQGPVPL